MALPTRPFHVTRVLFDAKDIDIGIEVFANFLHSTFFILVVIRNIFHDNVPIYIYIYARAF